MAVSRESPFVRPILILCLVSAVASAGWGLWSARHWPLLGDSALIRYVVFLIQNGHAPYRQIQDINLPGSYLLEWVTMKMFGAGAVGLRLYDTALCVAACALMAGLSGAGVRARSFGAAAGMIFLLVHLQDGLGQAGQRDFAMAVLALGACACLLRIKGVAGGLEFGVLVGLTVIVKPTLLPLVLLPLLLPIRKRIVWALAGAAIPVVAAGLWLWKWDALHGFFTVFSSIGVMHGEMGRRGLGFLLAHCTSPILALFALWVLVLLVARLPWDDERRALLFAAGCGLLSYVVQGKAYPYQRYPFVAFCLMLMARDLARALEGRVAARVLALGTAGVACFWFAPHFARVVSTFTGTDVFEQQLAGELGRLAPGSVQCLDTFGGCVNTLYDLKIVQSTGFLYDCYLFAGASSRREAYRAEFLRAFDAARPGVVVLTDQFCFDGLHSFDRPQTWMALDRRLQQEYEVGAEWKVEEMQRWWTRGERPAGFRVYVRR